MASQKDKSSYQKPIREEDLSGFKYFKQFTPILDHLRDSYRHHNRKLLYDQYISLILFYFFNPILTSLRGLQAATELKKVQKVLGIKPTSRTCLSEASHLFDASLIEPLIAQLAKKASPVEKDPKLKALQQTLVAVDGTLLPALPKMLWALWVDDNHRAAKMHLSFSVIKHVPQAAKVTDANTNEKTIFRELLAPDNLYVLDAGYAQYGLFKEIDEAGSSFVVRLRENSVWETIEERTLTAEDEAAGIKQDVIVRLGSPTKRKDISKPVRVIELEYHNDSPPRRSRVSSKKTFRIRDTKHNIILVTNRMDLSSEVIALLYKYRWQVELFFRWFKQILSCQHMLAISRNGLTLQVYTALIASLLISLWTGKKPTKRTFEMICMYFAGWADEGELFDHIEKLKKD